MGKEELEQENAQLREIIRRYHHHLKVWNLLREASVPEIGAWILTGEKLQWDAEIVVPALK